VRNIQKSSYDGGSKKVISIYMRFLNSKGVIVLNILQDYFKSTFNSLVLLPDQSLLVLNEDNQLIYSNKEQDYIDNLNLQSFSEKGDFNKTIIADKRKYTVNQITSSLYNWKFILVTPRTSFYQMPFKISGMAGLALIISFLLGLAFTFYITQKNYSQLKRILSILESAEDGRPLPAYPDRIKDEYGYIMHNMLKTFIEQSYLKMQLSEKKYKLKLMELMALQSQINPHFLFNTLATVSWESIIHMGKDNHINNMIENLSDILRYSLENPNETVTLKKEIENTKNYIEIQKFRYMDKFGVIWKCDDNIEDLKVTKLILQPLIENSIYHGIKEKESRSCIKIKISTDLKYINIAVIDSGIGMTKAEVQEISERLNTDEERYEHIGLYNINKRLKLIYGAEYGLKIRSKYGLGTAVYIRMPKEIP
jgi:two-component system sensor histidine kinase YesM